jgi:hypothetical protein
MPETKNDASGVAKSSTGAPRAAASLEFQARASRASSLSAGVGRKAQFAVVACGEAAADHPAAGSV